VIHPETSQFHSLWWILGSWRMGRVNPDWHSQSGCKRPLHVVAPLRSETWYAASVLAAIKFVAWIIAGLGRNLFLAYYIREFATND
jgi:hypothetical protein